MQVSAQRIRDVLRRLVQHHGTATFKARLWDAEFASERWAHLESTPGDFVYAHLEKYAAGGSILDLGCGSGSTGCEVACDAYRSYTGVDISAEALARAWNRAHEQGRGHKNRYLQADVLQYQPSEYFDVILFRDSLYYVPRNRVDKVLSRYARHLTARGVFLVRLYDGGGKYQTLVETIERGFEVVEKSQGFSSAIVLVFRPRKNLPSLQ